MKLAYWGSLMSPYKLGLQFIIVCCRDELIIRTLKAISIAEMPFSYSFGFVIMKLSFKVSTIWINPSPFFEFTLEPFTDKFHSSRIKYVCTLTVFSISCPFSWIHIFISINKHPLTLLLPLLPFSIILRFINII